MNKRIYKSKYNTINWERFGVRIISLAHPTMKIKLMKQFRRKFDGMKSRAMCTQRQLFRILFSLLSSLLVLIHDVNSKLLQSEGWSSGSQRVVVNMSTNTSGCPCKQGSEEGYRGQRQALVSNLYTW